MNIKVEIDAGSGFCYGVIRAVEQAEHYLKFNSRLYSLGDIVHNSLELDRLKGKGLKILTAKDVRNLKNDVILIRAHGEPPETYRMARDNNLQIIDCTCPVVLKLQEKIRSTYLEIKEAEGQIVIFGKAGHAEVNGLVGQTDGTAIVIDGVRGLDLIDFERPIALFSQTTKDPVEYERTAAYMLERGKNVKVFNTICRQVASRHNSLVRFAESHSIVLFVSGKESSNGKVLYDLCKSVNPRSYWLENKDLIDPTWFKDGDFVGICGATSTPKWQLEEIKAKLSYIIF
ncbi:MAG: 4-hydroxy-3-methylbut-2-enyl diphosphate reductase [Bacteroidales bacterium]|nr:4-hydroxy-3-methylbut-2-enyl diphosphate reductase [Bacteroidales bacterium]MDD4669626.1 4-hydroxy-3-methylbut-2-enyl diphosphate reductase [Bacteroidales bacterium]